MNKILAIDDNQDNLYSVTEILKDQILGCRVLTALTGPEGIKKAKAEQPDAILLDIHMPEMDGFEVCRILKADEEVKHIPVIMLTAVRTDSKSRVKGLELGADSFLAKPIDRSELTAQVKAMLRIKKAEDLLRKEKDVLSEMVDEKTGQLQSEKNRAQMYLDIAGIILVALDAEGKVVLINPKGCSVLGYYKNDILGKNWFDNFIPKRIKETMLDVFHRLMAGDVEPVACFENPVLTKDGKEKIIQFNNTVTRDQTGATTGIFFSGEDITEKRSYEHERIRLTNAIEQADEAIIITSKERIIQYTNPAFERITDYAPAEIIGQDINILRSDKHAEEFHKEIWDTISLGQVWKGRFINKKKDGSLYNAAATISPIKDAQGTITGFVNISRDITEELQREEQLRQTQKMEAIGTLAGGIAHDFNNILSGIIGYTELSLDDIAKDSPAHGYLNIVLKTCKRASDLVSQILMFSRKSEEKMKPVKLSPIIKECIKLLRASLPATIEIRQNLDERSGVVVANPTQIHQIVMNLCTNAAQAITGDNGLLDISLTSAILTEDDVTAYEGLNPGPYVKLTIRDNGCGIAPENIDRVFEPFFTTKEPGKGTGMGLSVTHGIVRSHGGLIKVESRPEKGTTFDILLPQAEIESSQEDDCSTQIMTGTGHILFVDDEEMLTRIAQRIISSLGYTVTVANTAFEALAVFEKTPARFDLVITDQSMPKMTGYNLAKKLMEIRSDIPVILCSGYSETLSEEDVKKIGIKAFVVKPLAKAKISKIIHDALTPRGA